MMSDNNNDHNCVVFLCIHLAQGSLEKQSCPKKCVPCAAAPAVIEFFRSQSFADGVSPENEHAQPAVLIITACNEN